MFMSDEFFIEGHGSRFGVKRWGDAGGIPVLALHGWLDNAATYDFLAPLLNGVQLVAMDFAGHGLSDHRSVDARYHYIDYIPDVIEVADALGWREFALLGHSLGAGVAVLTAGTIPDRVGKLVLIEGIGPLIGETDKIPLYLSSSIKQERRLRDKRKPVYPTVERMVEARAKTGDLTRELCDPLVSRNRVALEGGYTWRSDARLKNTSPLYMTEEQVSPFLRNVTAETLLITGESGYLHQREYFESRRDCVSRLTHRSLPGGHYPHMESPERVADLINPFLAG